MKIFRIFVFLLAVIMAVPVGYYVYQDNESLELNEETRKNLSGSFVKTPSGVTPYELVGADAAEHVVLVHVFSTPRFLWEPTSQYL